MRQSTILEIRIGPCGHAFNCHCAVLHNITPITAHPQETLVTIIMSILPLLTGTIFRQQKFKKSCAPWSSRVALTSDTEVGEDIVSIKEGVTRVEEETLGRCTGVLCHCTLWRCLRSDSKIKLHIWKMSRFRKSVKHNIQPVFFLCSRSEWRMVLVSNATPTPRSTTFGRHLFAFVILESHFILYAIVQVYKFTKTL